jgi:hypothetical protein
MPKRLGLRKGFTMSNLELTRAKIIDQLWEKHSSGQLVWALRSNENSYETSAGEFSFHIDRKIVASKAKYRVWVFDKIGETIDSYDPATILEFHPDEQEFSDYNYLVQKLYKLIKDGLTLEKLEPALEKLKSL